MNVLLHKEIFNGSVSQTDVSYLIQTIIRKKHRRFKAPQSLRDSAPKGEQARQLPLPVTTPPVKK